MYVLYHQAVWPLMLRYNDMVHLYKEEEAVSWYYGKYITLAQYAAAV